MDPFQDFLIDQLQRRHLVQMILLDAFREEQSHDSEPDQKIFLSEEERIVKTQEYQAYSPQIKDLYNSIFTTDQYSGQYLYIHSKLNFPQRKTEIPACNTHVYKQKIKFYYCYDCQNNVDSQDSSQGGNHHILCEKCFQNGDHKGHRYKTNLARGKCDCGTNSDKFKGTCKNHSGKIPLVQINEEQARTFNKKMSALFDWIFRLIQSQHQLIQEGQQLAQIVCHFLKHLNEESVYYNYLTSQLFFQAQMSGKRQLIIHKLFKYGLKKQDYVKQLTEIFCSLLFIVEFRCKIAVEYTIAYNTIEGFQQSDFKYIFPQIFSNESVLEYCASQNVILKPQKISYSYYEYFLSLSSYIVNVQRNVCVQYINALLLQGPIQLNMLSELYKKNSDNNLSMEKILTKSNIIEEETYYMLFIQMLKYCKNDPKIAEKLLVNQFNQLLAFSYEFQQNKIVFPYQRLFMLTIFALFKGNLQNVKLKTLLQVLNLNNSPQILKNLLKNKILVKALASLYEYAKTLISQDLANCAFQYFKGPSSTKIIDMDILSFKMCIALLSQKPNQLNVTTEVFKGMFQEIQDQQLRANSSILDIFISVVKNKKAKFQHSNLQNVFLKIILSSLISTKSQLFLKNLIQIQSQEINEENKIFWQKFSLNFNSFEESMFKELIGYIFTFDIRKKKYLASTLMFNDQTSKFTVDPTFSKAIQITERYPLEKITSIKKVFSNVKGYIQQKDSKLTLIKQCSFQSKLGHILFSENSVNYLINEKIKYFQKSLNFASQQVSLKQRTQFKSFFQIIMDINQAVFGGTQPTINNFFIEMKQKSKKDKYSFLKDFYPQKQKTENNLNKQKMNEKKSKRMKQLKQKQSSFASSEDDFIVQEEELQCIVCKEKSLDNFNNLCYLADFRHSNIIQSFTQTKGSFLIFNSCFHCIHMSCFTKLIKDKSYAQCPLCKKRSNIILPTQKQLLNGNPISLYIMERIESQRKSQQLPNQNYSQVQRDIFFYIINSLVYKCCLNLAQMGRYLKEKQIKIMRILYLFAKNLYDSSQISQKKSKQRSANEYLQDLSQLQILMKRRSSYPGYALFAILFKLSYKNIINQQLQKGKLFEEFSAILDQREIQHCWLVVQKIIESNYKMQIENLELYSNSSKNNKKQIVVHESSKKTLLKRLFVFYDPPKKIDDMLKIRDTCLSTCTKEHQEFICIICQWRGCYNCKKVKQHIKSKHLGEGILFNGSTGQIICYLKYISYLTTIPSLYQNRLGIAWTPSKRPQTYELDLKLYNKIIDYFLNNQLQAYIVRKEKQMKFRVD